MRERRRRPLLMATGFVVVGTAAQLLRQPGSHVWDTVWAEDGSLYTSDALSHPALITIGRGYNGYVQVLPRLLALGTRLVPTARISTYLAFSAALVTSLLGLVVVRSAQGWIRSTPLRWCLGLMTVLAPAAYFEVNVNLANLGWPMLVASFWAIASRQEGRADLAVRIVVVVLTALTTSVAVVLVPWAVLVVALRRQRRDVILGSAFGVAVVVQALADASTAAVQPPGGWQLGYVAKSYVARVLGSVAIGERWIPSLWISHPQVLMVGSTLIVLAVAAAGIVFNLRRPPPATPDDRVPSTSDRGSVPSTAVRSALGRLRFDRWWLAGGAALLSLVIYVATTWIRGAAQVGLTTSLGQFSEGGSRYLYVPVLLLFSALVVLADGTDRRWLQYGFVAWTVVVVVSSLRLGTLRSHGPSWAAGVVTARATCQAHPGLSSVQVPTSPGPGWFVTLPCSRVR